MKASYKKKDHKFVIVMLLISAVCCILTNAAYNSGVSNFAASVVGVIVTPLQKLAADVHEGIIDVGEYFGNVKKLKEENSELKQQIIALTRENSELTPLKNENNMLYHFLELKKERTDLKLVNAEIVSRSVSNYTSDFTVDKGSLHGINKDMAVVTEDGSLLGIIIEVGATYSRGKTLTSYDISVGIKNERTGEPGMLAGSFDLSTRNLCRVKDLYDSADYVVGDIIRTSSLGDIYPPGLYIGTVKELVPDGFGYTLNAVVEPSASINSTDMVMIITDFDRNYVEVPPSSEMMVLPNSSESVDDSEDDAEEDVNTLPGDLPAVPDAITNIIITTDETITVEGEYPEDDPVMNLSSEQ